MFQQSFAVAEVGLHEDYNSFNINNDICMLTLDEPSGERQAKKGPTKNTNNDIFMLS